MSVCARPCSHSITRLPGTTRSAAPKRAPGAHRLIHRVRSSRGALAPEVRESRHVRGRATAEVQARTAKRACRKRPRGRLRHILPCRGGEAVHRGDHGCGTPPASASLRSTHRTACGLLAGIARISFSRGRRRNSAPCRSAAPRARSCRAEVVAARHAARRAPPGQRVVWRRRFSAGGVPPRSIQQHRLGQGDRFMASLRKACCHDKHDNRGNRR